MPDRSAPEHDDVPRVPRGTRLRTRLLSMALLVSAPPLLVSVLMPMPNSGYLRVLFVSGDSDDAVRWKGKSLNERALLPKPFTSRELARRVRVMLDQSPRVS